jgi:hypothetical protein
LDIKKLILKIARDTGWGYTTVLGELRKLTKQKISRQTVANIMREAGLEPGPKRGEKTWDEFVRIHSATLWQCDFFAKRAWTLRGLRYLYVLVFLNVATGKVFVTKSTEHPNTGWITERASEFVRHAHDNKLGVDLVFHDADRKFGKARSVCRCHRHTPSWIGQLSHPRQSLRLEVLDVHRALPAVIGAQVAGDHFAGELVEVPVGHAAVHELREADDRARLTGLAVEERLPIDLADGEQRTVP